MNTLSVTQARNRFTDLVDKAGRLLHEFVITVNGKPTAVIMSADEYESLKETADVLSDTDLLKQIIKSENEIRNGDYVTFDELKKEIGYQHV